MTRKNFTVSPALARNLKRVSDRVAKNGGIPHSEIRREMLADMAIELKARAKSFARTGRGAKELLECLFVAEVEGVDPRALEEIRRDLGEKIRRRKAA